MILIISLCKEKLHDLEFVKPIEKIVKKINGDYFIKNYKEVKEVDLEKGDKVILSGTSLKDFEYLKNLEKFSWIKEFDKPILGICAGMQIIGLIFGGNLIENKEIGNLSGKYFLHNKGVSLPSNFEVLEGSKKFPTSFKHKRKKIYGVLFHPEVLNSEVVEDFSKFLNSRAVKGNFKG